MTRHQIFAPSTGTFIAVPKENEKSEPFSNRKQVRIFLVWWAMRDSNPHWSGYEPPALTVKLMALMKFERTCEGRSNDPS